MNPDPAYEGDTVTITVYSEDDDGDNLDIGLSYTIGSETVSLGELNNVPSGSSRTFSLTDVNAGVIELDAYSRDPYGERGTDERSFTVNSIKIEGIMLPNDPMAGDELIFSIETVGGVDYLELVLEDDVTDNDERTSMGYTAQTYPFKVDIDESKLSKITYFSYILWCTTPQSLTLKGVRQRDAYDFTIRAWKGDHYEDLTFTREVQGDVRELIKVGYE